MFRMLAEIENSDKTRPELDDFLQSRMQSSKRETHRLNEATRRLLVARLSKIEDDEIGLPRRAERRRNKFFREFGVEFSFSGPIFGRSPTQVLLTSTIDDGPGVRKPHHAHGATRLCRNGSGRTSGPCTYFPCRNIFEHRFLYGPCRNQLLVNDIYRSQRLKNELDAADGEIRKRRICRPYFLVDCKRIVNELRAENKEKLLRQKIKKAYVKNQERKPLPYEINYGKLLPIRLIH